MNTSRRASYARQLACALDSMSNGDIDWTAIDCASEELRRLYQRVHELETLLKDIAEYTGEGPPTTDWQGIVKLVSGSARGALEEQRGEWVGDKEYWEAPHLPALQRMPLEQEQLEALLNSESQSGRQWSLWTFARAIERAHGIGCADTNPENIRKSTT